MNIFAGSLLLAYGGLLLYHLTLLWIHGRVVIYEDSRVILGFEMALGMFTIGVGLYLLRRH